MAEHNELGKLGEEIALGHLREKGYLIKETNWRFGKDEIDIIAEKDKFLVIVEVKTRQSNAFGEPEVFVTTQKQRFLIRATQVYLERNKIDLETRFDVISIVISGSKRNIKHIEDAFYPTMN
ncbi:MAG: YraN family protein [Lentimicrobiaceae bacterium]|jgi:putative endonuclease|nr:YraN family protein [Lentimicrobiaceae bacterium]MDD4598165.1 YraN family protein [Lentimicrobiaceae bacterium]MDY0026091.1 YraN family protein [Lentimicrobium sp.]HAH57223.1 YraN family protein [Bacteroidales bacterium]